MEEMLSNEKRENKGLKSELESSKEEFERQTKKYDQLETVKKEMDFNINELNAELENSEDQREGLKKDINDTNDKIIVLEEDLYEAKTVQLEILENLKQAEDKIEDLETTIE